MNDMTSTPNLTSTTTPAEIVREYGPFEDAPHVHGVTYDGAHLWFASGERLNAVDPASGRIVRVIELPASAGTAYDGRHLFQLAGGRIHKIDAHTGAVITSIPAPADDSAGLTWAEGSLWVGQFRGRKIHQIDPETGAVLRSLDSDRFVTGVTFVGGELWHGTGDDQGKSELRRIDPRSGAVLKRLALPEGHAVTGLESNGSDLLFCGGGRSGRVRAVRKRA